jgi:hypothetical protein
VSRDSPPGADLTGQARGALRDSSYVDFEGVRSTMRFQDELMSFRSRSEFRSAPAESCSRLRIPPFLTAPASPVESHTQLGQFAISFRD